MAERHYLPAAGHDFFLPFYDPIVRMFGFSRAVAPLLAQAALEPGHRVVDVGCGTGTLAIEIKRRLREADVTGVDPDAKALARAANKARRAGIDVRFEQGFADDLPFADGSLDRVFSTMMFHHLHKEDRLKALREWRRVLKPGGRLEFLDFAGGSHNFLAQLVHGHQLALSADQRLLARLGEAGFTAARRTGDQGTIFGRLAFYQAVA